MDITLNTFNSCNLHPHNYNYKVDEENSKYTSYGYQLILLIDSLIEKPSYTIINDEAFLEANHHRLVDYLLSRIVNIGYYYLDKYTEISTDYEKKLKEKLEALLDIEEQILNKIFILTKHICINYEKTDPSQRIKDSIRRFAKSSMHGCYICGRKLDADKQTEYKKNK